MKLLEKRRRRHAVYTRRVDSLNGLAFEESPVNQSAMFTRHLCSYLYVFIFSYGPGRWWWMHNSTAPSYLPDARLSAPSRLPLLMLDSPPVFLSSLCSLAQMENNVGKRRAMITQTPEYVITGQQTTTIGVSYMLIHLVSSLWTIRADFSLSLFSLVISIYLLISGWPHVLVVLWQPSCNQQTQRDVMTWPSWAIALSSSPISSGMQKDGFIGCIAIDTLGLIWKDATRCSFIASQIDSSGNRSGDISLPHNQSIPSFRAAIYIWTGDGGWSFYGWHLITKLMSLYQCVGRDW